MLNVIVTSVGGKRDSSVDGWLTAWQFSGAGKSPAAAAAQTCFLSSAAAFIRFVIHLALFIPTLLLAAATRREAAAIPPTAPFAFWREPPFSFFICASAASSDAVLSFSCICSRRSLLTRVLVFFFVSAFLFLLCAALATRREAGGGWERAKGGEATHTQLFGCALCVRRCISCSFLFRFLHSFAPRDPSLTFLSYLSLYSVSFCRFLYS